MSSSLISRVQPLPSFHATTITSEVYTESGTKREQSGKDTIFRINSFAVSLLLVTAAKTRSERGGPVGINF